MLRYHTWIYQCKQFMIISTNGTLTFHVEFANWKLLLWILLCIWCTITMNKINNGDQLHKKENCHKIVRVRTICVVELWTFHDSWCWRESEHFEKYKCAARTFWIMSHIYIFVRNIHFAIKLHWLVWSFSNQYHDRHLRFSTTVVILLKMRHC